MVGLRVKRAGRGVGAAQFWSWLQMWMEKTKSFSAKAPALQSVSIGVSPSQLAMATPNQLHDIAFSTLDGNAAKVKVPPDVPFYTHACDARSKSRTHAVIEIAVAEDFANSILGSLICKGRGWRPFAEPVAHPGHNRS